MSTKKDEGIAEIIAAAESARLGARADSVEYNSPEAAEAKSRLSNTSNNNNNNNINKKDINVEPANTESIVNQQRDYVTQEGNIDLTDPKCVIQMLETVDLTEEDTEILLQEAYTMNRKLKEMLRCQEMTVSLSKKAKCKPLNKSASSEQQDSMGSSDVASRRTHEGSTFSTQKPLPPITTDGELASIYAVNLKRTCSMVPATKKLVTNSATFHSESSNTAGKQETDEGLQAICRKASGPKPEWNDRFNSY